MADSGSISTGFFIMILLYLMVRRGFFKRLEVERAGKAGKKSLPPPRADEDTISPAAHSFTVIFFFVFVFFMFVYSIIYE